MEPLKPRDKVTQHMTRDGLTLDNQTTGESVNVSSREAEQEYTAQPEGAAEKILERADELHDRHKAKKAAKDAGETVAVAAALCMATTTVTAYAGGADPDPVPLPETTEAPAEVPEETEEPTTGGMEPEGVPVTPQGNATLVDDFFGDKQLITVTTKAGNYFYILIDRANEDKETAVHFLNQVDDADLQALLEDGKKEPEVCNCTAKCQAGAVNTACPVCKNNLTACNGPEPKPQPEEEKPQEEKPSGMGGLVVFFVVVLLGGGAALYFLKFKKEKADTTGNDDLTEYDFGEDEDDEDEPAPEDESGTGEVEPRPLEDFLMDEDEPSKEDEE